MERTPLVRVPDEIRSVVSAELGEDGVEILDQLAELGEATDTTLSELLDKRTSQIRKALYGMYEHRIADYAEHRDPENGWLTFVWQITPEQGVTNLEQAKQEAAEELRAQIDYEREHDFYTCPKDHMRLPFCEAMDVEFTCAHCGDHLEAEDKEQRLAELDAQLKSLESSLAEA